MVVFQGHVGVVLLFLLSWGQSDSIDHVVVIMHALIGVRHLEATIVSASKLKHLPRIVGRPNILGLVASLVHAPAVPSSLGPRLGEVRRVLQHFRGDSTAVVDVWQLSVSFGSREHAIVRFSQVLSIVLAAAAIFSVVGAHVAVAYGFVDVLSGDHAFG